MAWRGVWVWDAATFPHGPRRQIGRADHTLAPFSIDFADVVNGGHSCSSHIYIETHP